MKNLYKIILILVFMVPMTGCSDVSNTADTNKDHVWKAQTDTINKAREVEGILRDSAAATRKSIDQQSD